MDSIDKGIILSLDRNCRISYQALAADIGITPNAVRKRLNNLIESGIIEEFVVGLRPAMTGCDYLVALVYTDGKEDDDELIDHLGTNLSLVQAGQIVTSSNRLYFINAEYENAHDLKEIASFLRSIEHVNHLELHTIPIPRGEKFAIKRLHLQVLKLLLKDARMPVTDIAKKLATTSRRVSRALKEMQDSNAIWFSARWNLSLGDNTEFYLKVNYDEKSSSKEVADRWLRENYPSEYWFSFYSALEPVMFSKFVTEHFRKAEIISRNVKNASFCNSVDVLLSYPVRKFPRLGTLRIREMIHEAGID